MTTNDNYLTMARIMKAEWEKFQKKSVWGQGLTGIQEIHVKEAFQSGFMAGFSGRYFNTEEN